MKLRTFFLFFGIFALIITSCEEDEEGSVVTIEIRDPEEVAVENLDEIENFMDTHYYELQENPTNPNFRIFTFGPIEGENEDRPPISESPFLMDTTIIQRDVSYKLYYLKFREGNPEERKPKFVDSTLVTYQGLTLDNVNFDAAPNPIWFDITNNIRGFQELLTKLSGASGYEENPDGTVTFNDDFGKGVVFIPSGLAYFSAPPSGSSIEPYKPIIFSVQLYKSRENDHDLDGIPSYKEDLNNNGRINESATSEDVGDDLDGDGLANFVDEDDDGDGVLTIDEISDDEGNTIIPYPDYNNDGTPDYLDPDYPGEND